MSDEAAQRELAAELQAEVIELRVSLAKAEAELGAVRAGTEAEVAARNAMLEQMRDALAHERTERAKLAVELAEARKPALVRLLEALRRR